MFTKQIDTLLRQIISESIQPGINVLMSKYASSDECIVDYIDYDELIGYFATNKPDHEKIKKYCLLREINRSSWMYTQCFLDEENNPIKNKSGNIYGRKIIALKSDDEINDLFKDLNIVIFDLS